MDTGGPLAIRNGDGTSTVVGLASFGMDKECNRESGRPIIYTRVSSFLNWIQIYSRSSEVTGEETSALVPYSQKEPARTAVSCTDQSYPKGGSGRRYRQGQSGREDQSREKAQFGEKINEAPFMMCRSESPFLGGLDHIKWLKGTETVTNIHKIRDTKQFLNVFDEKLVCGGVIISNRTILTAANCIPKNFDFIRIYFGTVDALNNMETGQQRLQVNKKYIVVHPEWDPKQDINDIALIKLPADLQFDDYIKPAQLPDPNQSYENESAVVSVYASSTGQLMYSNETVLSNEKCRCTLQRYRPGVFFPSSWICLKPADCGPCKGDSGGPLAIRHEDGSSTLLGLIKSVKDEPKQFPYQVLLNQQTDTGWTPFCGGVIISNRIILTAAHCILDDLPAVKIYFGAVDRNNIKETGQQRLIVKQKNIVVHPEYDPNNLLNDLALIKLPADLQFDDYIQPAQLPDPNQFYENEIAVVSGWGKSSVPGSMTSQLQYYNVTVLSNEECKSILHKYQPGMFFPSSWICLSPSERSPCSGDSGGPLVLRNGDGTNTLLGVASFVTDALCTVNRPTVYTRISSLLSWIEKYHAIIPDK
ncbi:hypothetical protein ACLKA6_018444 [Drosophila palustris]